MGIKPFLAGTAAALLLPALWANPRSDRELYRETIKNVDLGGSYLGYQNNRSLNEFFTKAPAVISAACKSFLPQQECYEACRILFKMLNLQAVQAGAASIAHPQPDQTVIKSSAYLGSNMNSSGIHRWFGTGNQVVCVFEKLPDDTRLFISYDIRLGDAAQMLAQELRNSSVPKFRTLPDMIDQDAGIDLTSLAATFNGRCIIMINGTSLTDGTALIYLPDANGTLTKLLKSKLPPADANGIVYLRNLENPAYPNFKPLVIYRKGGVLFSTGNRQIKSAGAFAKYKQFVPAQANAYFLCDLDAATIATIRNAVAGDADAIALLSPLQPFTIAAATFNDSKSINSVAFFNFNVGKALLELPGKLVDAFAALKKNKEAK